jgi:hypothetical protein
MKEGVVLMSKSKFFSYKSTTVYFKACMPYRVYVCLYNEYPMYPDPHEL